MCASACTLLGADWQHGADRLSFIRLQVCCIQSCITTSELHHSAHTTNYATRVQLYVYSDCLRILSEYS